MPDIVLDDKRAGPHLEVLEQGRAVRQTASTTHFEGAWCLANLGFSSGQWRCTFSIRKRRRWMAATGPRVPRAPDWKVERDRRAKEDQ